MFKGITFPVIEELNKEILVNKENVCFGLTSTFNAFDNFKDAYDYIESVNSKNWSLIGSDRVVNPYDFKNNTRIESKEWKVEGVCNVFINESVKEDEAITPSKTGFECVVWVLLM
jgi:hypothetical protein